MGYDYEFYLEWRELDEELRYQKVRDSFQYLVDVGEYSDVLDSKTSAGMPKEEAVEELFNEEFYSLEQRIIARFPVYY
ncbi:MAG: hypothetical protein KJ760_19165 [Proteobacteria bacterium]|nr:hypothetical protein [Pseudomonadota bacterium]